MVHTFWGVLTCDTKIFTFSYGHPYASNPDLLVSDLPVLSLPSSWPSGQAIDRGPGICDLSCRATSPSTQSRWQALPLWEDLLHLLSFKSILSMAIRQLLSILRLYPHAEPITHKLSWAFPLFCLYGTYHIGRALVKLRQVTQRLTLPVYELTHSVWSWSGSMSDVQFQSYDGLQLGLSDFMILYSYKHILIDSASHKVTWYPTCKLSISTWTQSYARSYFSKGI